MLTENAAHELTYFVALEWEDADRQVLAPLADAALVWAYPDQMAELALPIVESLWADGLRDDIERALAGADLPMHCLLCLEDGLVAAPAAKRRALALGVAQLARRVLDIPDTEIRAAVAAAAAVGGPDVAAALATEERRTVVRDWLVSRSSASGRSRLSPKSSTPCSASRARSRPRTRCGGRRPPAWPRGSERSKN